ncbi:MAG: hypothetical protein PWQ10_302 [Patescibacteria group bacterium]|nr:hypothetical protein [Patescibacteria group bacterium]
MKISTGSWSRRILEITRGEFANDILKQANSKFGLFPNSEFICMDLFLSFGDISNIRSVNSRTIFNETINTKNQIDELLNTLKGHDKVRIWTSTAKTEDYLNMMFVVDLIKSANIEIEISIVDSVNVPVSDRYPETAAWELACLEIDGIKKLLAFEEAVSDEKVNEISQSWRDIVTINSSLRICNDGVIKSVDDNYFDQMILDTINESDTTQKAEVIGATMARCNHADGNLIDLFFADRLEKLIK